MPFGAILRDGAGRTHPARIPEGLINTIRLMVFRTYHQEAVDFVFQGERDAEWQPIFSSDELVFNPPAQLYPCK